MRKIIFAFIIVVVLPLCFVLSIDIGYSFEGKVIYKKYNKAHNDRVVTQMINKVGNSTITVPMVRIIRYDENW